VHCDGSQEAALFTAEEAAGWYGLLRAHACTTARVEGELQRQYGLSIGAIDVICHLWLNRSPQPVRAITGHMVGITPTRVSRVVQDLVDGGYVVRSADQCDGRVSLVSLSESGVEFAREVAESVGGVVRRTFLDLLDADDLAALARIRTKLEQGRDVGAATP
jgi:DNA-binding MarR family transcriptional regulator